MMSEWVRIGTRFIHLDNIAEVRFHKHPHVAHIFYVGGGAAELNEEEADELRQVLDEKALEPEPEHRRVSTSTVNG